MLERARADLNELRVHCRRLQAQVSAFHAAETMQFDPRHTATSSTSVPSSPPRSTADLTSEAHSRDEHQPLHGLTAKRLLVWGLLPSLVCPLSRAIMQDPVCAADGWTYERRWILHHIAKSGRAMPLSPVTGQKLPSRNVVACHVVAQLVRQHLPDLAPPEVKLPIIRLMHIWQVQEILSFLDAKSLARCEIAWSSFLAASDESRAWARLLELDYPQVGSSAIVAEACGGQPEGEGGPPAAAETAAMELRRLYAKAAAPSQASRTAIAGGGSSKGLTLFKK